MVRLGTAGCVTLTLFYLAEANAQSMLPPVTVDAPTPRAISRPASSKRTVVNRGASRRMAQAPPRQSAPAVAPLASENSAAGRQDNALAPGGLTLNATSGGALGKRSTLQTPFSTSGFSEKLIKDQQALTPSDVLKNDASVTLASTYGYFTDVPYIRGFPLGTSGPLYDGQSFDGLNKFALEGIERIEVFKGPAAVLFGVGLSPAIGGVVNFVPKRPLPFDYNSVTTSWIQNSYVQTAVDFSRRYGENREFGIRFNGAYGDGQFQNDTGLRHDLAQLNLDWRPSDSVRLYADILYVENINRRDQLPFTLEPGLPIPAPFSSRRNYAQQWNYTENPAALGFVKAEVDLNETWTLDLSARSYWLGNNFLAILPTISNAAGAYTQFGFYFPSSSGTNVGGQANLRGKFDTGGLRHEVSFGVDVQRARNLAGPFMFDGPFFSNIYNPVYVPKPSIVTGPQRPLSEQSVNSASATDLVTLAGGFFQVLGGVRHVSYSSKNFDYNLDEPVNTLNQSKDLPVGAILFHPTQNTTIYASYAQGFEPGNPAPVGAVNALSLLPPIASEQFEVGAKAQLSWLTASVAAFRINRNLQYLDPTSLVFVDNGRQIHDGFEASLSGEPIKGTRFIASAMVLDPRVSNTGDPNTESRVPIGVPRFQTSMFVDQDIPWLPGLSVNGGVYYVGSQFYDLTNTLAIDAFTRADVGLKYRTLIARYTATFRFNVENVTDLNYYASPVNGLALGTPRTFKFSAQLQW